MRRRGVYCGRADGMVSPSNTLSARMTHWDVLGRRFHPLVYFTDLCCTATSGWRASAFWRCVVTMSGL